MKDLVDVVPSQEVRASSHKSNKGTRETRCQKLEKIVVRFNF